MVKTVTQYMERHQMIENEDVIVAGVSGGADSVCLFLILEEYCKKKNAKLVVVHVNHGIRTEAKEDALYVKELCEEFGIEFYLFEKDIIAEAKHLGIGTEEAGRKARYEAFYQVLAQQGGRGKIAVAHNKGDQAETVMFHLLRGSNIAGLSGIAPVRDNIIRPLLCVERSRIEAFLQEKGRRFCIDSTNEENTYTRNKIRNVLLPYASKEICEQSVAHIADAAEELLKLRFYIEDVAAGLEKEILSVKENRVIINKESFDAQPEIIKQQLILRALEYLVPGRKDIGAVHIRDVISLCKKESGKQIVLPYGLIAENVFEQIVVRKKEKEKKKNNYKIQIPGKVSLDNGITIEFAVFPINKEAEIPRKTYTKWFDYDKIISCLEIRNRTTGDYLTISESGNRKSIKEYFIEEKVPKEKREDMFLLTEGSHVLWVIGKRISEYYKITEQTKTVLQVTVLDENESI